MNDVKRLSDSDSSSCDSLAGLDLPTIFPTRGMENRKRAAGTMQREMNALFAQKMEEIRSKSPLFFAGKVFVVRWILVVRMSQCLSRIDFSRL